MLHSEASFRYCVPTPASEALKTPLSGWVLVTTPPQHSEPGALSQGQGPAGRTRAQPWVPSVSQLSSAALEKQLSGAVGVGCCRLWCEQ